MRAKILATRARMATELATLGFDVTPSHSNFLWCRHADRPVKPIYEELKAAARSWFATWTTRPVRLGRRTVRKDGSPHSPLARMQRLIGCSPS